MKKDAFMNINRETAIMLWNKRYGKVTKVKDFAGREMDKGSYGNRNSKYGWNLDHILPQTQGGKNSESNLICSHIKTNDEKANKFPCFVANEKNFEIIKVQNHYEIKLTSNEENEEDDNINFFDHSEALAFFKECQENKYWIGTIHIKLNGVKEVALLDFIREMLSDYEISIKQTNNQWNPTNDFKIEVIIFGVNTKEETQNILDDCVLLNTYLKYYFLEHNYISSYFIINNLYGYNYQIDENDFKEPSFNISDNSENCLIINELIRHNTSARKEKLNNFGYNEDYWVYDYSYIKLRQNLGKVKNN